MNEQYYNPVDGSIKYLNLYCFNTVRKTSLSQIRTKESEAIDHEERRTSARQDFC